jgi:tetratricopeptide (TPR) repeat protein
MKIYKKYIVLLAIVAGAFYFASTNFKWSIPTKDCLGEPSPACLNEAIKNFDYENNLKQAEDRYARPQYAEALIHAGYYEKGIELLAKGDRPMGYVSIIDWAAQQVAEAAFTNPDKVASFEVLEMLKNPSTMVGSIIQKQQPVPVEQSFFSKLSFYLTGNASAGAGDSNYVHYNEKMALKKFRPNATWGHLITVWRDHSLTLPEPAKSSEILIIAAQLRRVGNHAEAYNTLQLLHPNKENAKRYVDELEALGRLDEARAIRDHLLSSAQSTFAFAEIAAAKKQPQAISLLKKAAEETINSDSPNQTGKENAGLLRWISKLLYDGGDKEAALEIAEKAYEIERTHPISKNFISYTEVASHYRAIGHPEKAKELLERFKDASTNSCSPFADLDGLAKEFYHLGMIEITAQKISAFCDSVTVFGTPFGLSTAKIDKKKYQLSVWSEIYQDAVISGKETKEIEKYAGQEVVESSDPYLAMYYLNHDDPVRGEEYLTKAIEGSYYERPACQLAYLANSAGRKDLLEHNFTQSLKIISQHKKGLERQTAYLELAACYNQIKISNLAP